jgi:hypothetical protein
MFERTWRPGYIVGSDRRFTAQSSRVFRYLGLWCVIEAFP